jgi:ABC-type transport system substrate-binding protein
MSPISIAGVAAALSLIAAPALAQTAPAPAMSAPAPSPAPAPLSAAAGASVTVKGPGGATAVVTDADMQAMHRYSVTVGWGGGHTYAGAALSDLLAEVGAPSEARLHGPPLDQVVIVKGRDGFIGVLAMAETAMSFKGQPVILADQEDGKPLNDKEGPYRLVIGGELKPPRSVWGVVEIELRPIK